MSGGALPVCQPNIASTVWCDRTEAGGKIKTGYYKGAICTQCGVVLYTCSLTVEPGDLPQVCVDSCASCTDWR